MHSANQKIQGAQDKLYVSWLEWKRSIGYDDTDESHCAEVRKSLSLSVSLRILTVCVSVSPAWWHRQGIPATWGVEAGG